MGDLNLKNALLKNSVPLKSVVFTNPFTAYNFKKIVENKFSMCILIDHNGTSVPIKVCSTTCIDCISTNAIASGTLQPDHDCLITKNAEIRYT